MTRKNDKLRDNKSLRKEDMGIFENKCSSEVKIVIKKENQVTIINIEVSPSHSDSHLENNESRNLCDMKPSNPNINKTLRDGRGDPNEEYGDKVEKSGVECDKFNAKDESKRQS